MGLLSKLDSDLKDERSFEGFKQTLHCELSFATSVTLLFCPLGDPAATHLDVEAAQHGVDAEQVSDGVIYVAVKCCVGDWAPQEAEGLL